MARYFGGPLDGKSIRTDYDHLPVIDFPWPNNSIQEPQTVESYELRKGNRFHTGSREYQRPGTTKDHP